MSNNKTYIVFLTAIVFITGCRIKTIPFNDTKIVPSFFDQVTTLWGSPSIKRIDSITIYQAILQEELVDRDGIPEFKLMNPESKEPKADLVGRKNHHELYLCQIHTNKKGETLCVFIASSFDLKNKCTKLGPAYLGLIRMEQINIKKELKITARKDLSYFISGTAASDLLFIADRDIPLAYEKICNDTSWIDSGCNIGINEIINSNMNKIGGKKPTIYLTQKIFGDPNALLFRYYKTIKP